jgi:hypothetical protein
MLGAVGAVDTAHMLLPVLVEKVEVVRAAWRVVEQEHQILGVAVAVAEETLAATFSPVVEPAGPG